MSALATVDQTSDHPDWHVFHSPRPRNQPEFNDENNCGFRTSPTPHHPRAFARLALVAVLALLPLTGLAAVDPVVVRVPKAEAWIGEQVQFVVDIRVAGSFGGATTFTLPQVPGVLILRRGSAAVSTQNIEGDSWFVQSHTFSVFSQREGAIEIPSFSVRYGEREGFTGPVTEKEGHVPEFQLEVRRPPGMGTAGFLITTDQLNITERWEPKPTDAEVGATFKRTVTQVANDVSGMALAPLPRNAPDGIRVYTGDPTVEDQSERGTFIGTRSETLKYMFQKPGTFTLPEIRFVWWNSKTLVLETNTLPSVQIKIAAPPVTVAAGNGTEEVEHGSRVRLTWMVAILVVGMVLYRPLLASWRRVTAQINSPQRIALRDLQRACHDNDALSAYRAWLRTGRTATTPELTTAVRELEHALFAGDNKPNAWSGQRLADAVRRNQKQSPSIVAGYHALPPLNPTI